jgi:hypothetical protein
MLMTDIGVIGYDSSDLLDFMMDAMQYDMNLMVVMDVCVTVGQLL